MQKRLWLADGRSDNGCFHSRIRENGLHSETRRGPGWREPSWGWTRLTPLCSPTPAGLEAPFESSPSPLLPLARLHFATPSRRFQPPTFPFLPLSLPSSLSGARFKTDFLFSPFDSLILSSLSLSLPLLFPSVAEAVALQVSAAPTSCRGWRARRWWRPEKRGTKVVRGSGSGGGDGDGEDKKRAKWKRRTGLLTKGLNNES